jgi:hypothetical protein
MKTQSTFSALKILTVASMTIAGAQASDLTGVLDLQGLGFGGPGCNARDGLTLIDDLALNGEITIETAHLQSEITSGSIARSNCQLSIPAAIPAGKQLVVIEAKTQGAAELSSSGSSAESSLAIWTGVGSTRNEIKSTEASTGPMDDMFWISLKDELVTPCGQDQLVRIALVAKVSGSGGDRVSLSSTRVKFELRDCQ